MFIAGHSLGGALVTLAVAKFLEEGESVSAMYTYGQPMVGSIAFAEKFNRTFKYAYRLVNNEDIVTRVPFRQFNFRHIGCLYYFDNKRKMHIQPDETFVSTDRYEGVEVRSLQNFSRLRSLYPNEAEDHSLEQYTYNIKKAIREKDWESKPYGDFLKYVNN